MNTTPEASPEQIIKVHVALKRYAVPSGPMLEQIKDATGYPSYIINSATRALRVQGINVEEWNAYGSDVDTDDETVK
jgi:hypothetical protein